MPRNPDGSFSLVVGNPVVSETLITAQWANSTMPDLAEGIGGSLPLDGSVPMQGQLTLPAALASQPRHATSKAYVDQFMAFATGLPLAAVFPIASAVTLPAAYLLCDGQLVSRTTYADLFGAIGTTYGAGDGTSTFAVPDLRDWFVRGKPDNRAVGSTQADSLRSHSHGVSDPGHSHGVSDPTHNHAQSAHGHGVTDPGHTHTMPGAGADNLQNLGAFNVMLNNGITSTQSGPTGVSVNNATATNQAAASGVSVNSASTGINGTQSVGGSETTPKNIAFNYWIKAQNDTVDPVTNILGVTSSDPEIIAIDNTNPVYPQLDIKSNVAFGGVKLDASGKVPIGQLPTSAQTYLGPYDASTGNNPSEQYPSVVFYSGDVFVVVVQGTILVYDPVTFVPSMLLVTVGQNLTYVDNGINPVGWYVVTASITITATAVGLTPYGDITATNVQEGIEQLEDLKIPYTELGVTVMEHVAPGTADNVLTSDGAGNWTSQPQAGGGDVVGPASAVADNVTLFDGITGKLIKDSGVPIQSTPYAVTPINALLKYGSFGLGATAPANNPFGTDCNAYVYSGYFRMAGATNGPGGLTDFVMTVAAGNNIHSQLVVNPNTGAVWVRTYNGSVWVAWSQLLTTIGNAASASTAAACTGNSATATMSTTVPVSNTTGTLVKADTGKCVALTAGITVPNGVFAVGDVVSLYNQTASPITVTQGAGFLLRGPNVADGNKTLTPTSIATIWFVSAAAGIITGAA